MDPSIGELSEGDVLIVGGKISAVAESIPADNCEVIDASGAIVMPGFIDTHKHMWQTVLRGIYADWGMAQYGLMVRTIYPVCFDREDAYISNYAGALESIDAGVTSVVDHSHLQTSPEVTDALIQGSLDAGIGGFFCYGLYNNPTYTPGGPIDVEKVISEVMHTAQDWHYENAARAKEHFFSDYDGPLRFGVSTSEHVGMLSMDEIEQEFKAIDQLEPDLITAHGGTMPTGIKDLASRPVGPPWIREMEERKLLKDNMIFSHLNGLVDEEFEMLARSGASISTTVYTELSSSPVEIPLDQARRAGLKGSLGSDTAVMSGAEMFSLVRTLLLMERHKRNGFPDQLAPDGSANPKVEDYLKLLTSEAAEAVGLGDVIGSLTPGKQADIVMLSTDALNMFPVNDVGGAIMFHANVRDVDTVIIKGKVLKRNGKLIGVDLPAVRDKLSAAQARIHEKVAKVSPEEVIPVWANATIWNPDALK